MNIEKTMDKLMITLSVFVLFISCHSTSDKQSEKVGCVSNESTSKLASLSNLDPDSTLIFFDLSNDSIKEIPDLTKYSIKSLDMSGKNLSALPFELLPKGLEVLNLSNNNFKGLLFLYTEGLTNLKEINLSNNLLDSVSISLSLRKIILSYNNLTYLTFSHSAIEYLDISHNPKMSNIVYFFPEVIDTVIHNDILNEKPLVFWLYGAKIK